MITIYRSRAANLIPGIVSAVALTWALLLARYGERLLPLALFNMAVVVWLLALVFYAAEYEFGPRGIRKKWGLGPVQREQQYSLAEVVSLSVPTYSSKLVIELANGKHLKISLSGMQTDGALPELAFDGTVPFGPKRTALQLKAALERLKANSETLTHDDDRTR